VTVILGLFLQVRGAQDKVNEAEARIGAAEKSVAETAEDHRAVQAGSAVPPGSQALPCVRSTTQSFQAWDHAVSLVFIIA